MHKPKHFIRTTHARTDSNACFFGHRDILRFCRFATALTATSIGETATTDPKNGSNVLGQSVQVRPLQFPIQQMPQTVAVQVPVTTNNGQTIYQTVHFPVQALSNVFNVPQMMPQVTQVSCFLYFLYKNSQNNFTFVSYKKNRLLIVIFDLLFFFIIIPTCSGAF